MNLLKSLIVLLFFSCPTAWAIPAIDPSSFVGSLPRDLTDGNFYLSFKVKGVTVLEKTTKEYLPRVSVYVDKASLTTALPFDGNALPQGLNFVIYPNETLVKLEDDGSNTLSFDFRVKQTIDGELKKIVGTDDKLALKITYKDSSGEDKDEAFTLTRDNTVANEAPEFKSLVPTFKKLVASWTVKSDIVRSNGSTKPFSGLTMLAVRIGMGNSLTIPVKIFAPQEAEDTQTSTCQMNLDAEDGVNCLEGCPASSYIDFAALEEEYPERADVAVTKTTSNSGSLGTGGLEIDQEYMTLLVYEPDALVQSVCRRGTPVANLTLSEYYGEPDAKQSDPRCFIASSVYGSPDHPKVQIFRFFRDEVLLKIPGGAWMVEGYYRLSPPLADWLDQNEKVRSWARVFFDGLASLLAYFLTV